jgi:hypothetical protein
MRRCEDCGVDVEGTWPGCPLCGAPIAGPASANPLAVVPLEFSRRRLFQGLLHGSLAVILLSFAAQLLFPHELASLGTTRSIWLGVCAVWLIVLTAVRKRRNVAKTTVYLVIISSLVCVYWDYLTDWHAWSLTYTVPILCGAAALGLLSTVRLARIEVGEHLVYSAITVLLGLAPILFAALGWTTNPVPSVICGAISCAVIAPIQLLRGRAMRHELGKRLHL